MQVHTMNIQDIISSIPLQAGILLLLGLAFITISLYTTSAYKKLHKSGRSAEGIIFKLESGDTFTGTSDFSGNAKNIITVRFLTSESLWITGQVKSQFLISYTGQYKEGEKVQVKYNPDQPAEFILETRQSETTGRIIVFAAGLIMMASGIYQWLSN